MQYKVIWLTQAVEELQAIRGFIEQENPEAADYVVKQIYDAAQSLQNFPERHQKDPEKPKFRRLVVLPRYSIFYQVANHKVYIAHIWHAMLDKGKL